jgi:hypothetical protein
MNLSTIETFLMIADSGQLNRAATRLHVTQSTVTTRLNSLESELRQFLFQRRWPFLADFIVACPWRIIDRIDWRNRRWCDDAVGKQGNASQQKARLFSGASSRTHSQSLGSRKLARSDTMAVLLCNITKFSGFTNNNGQGVRCCGNKANI